MAILNDAQKAILSTKNFAHLATIGRDGAPQVTPVWVEYDGTHVLINSEKKRAKVKNMQRDARVALSVLNHENPYSYVEIQGRVVEIVEEGAFAHIDALAKKYMGVDKYPFNQDGDTRVIIKIEPEIVKGLRT